MLRLLMGVVLVTGMMHPEGQGQGGVSGLSWIAGCLELRTGARVVHEQWMPPLGGMMMGMSRTVVRDTVREFERLRIEMREGKVAYVAHPSRQTETVFLADSVSDSLVVFSNPTHDFPQRIIYRKRGADTVVARIEGPRGGQVRGIDFPFRRVGCGGVSTK